MEGKYVKIKEQNLIKQLKKKNPQAIDYIIDQYGGLIKTVLLKNLYDQKDHWEECFNDCLLAVWNHPERFDTKKGDFKAFLCAIAKYKAIDLLRKELKRTSKEISIYEEESIKEIKQLYQEERGFLQAEADASDEELGKLLKCLSEEDKDLFYRRYVKEQSVAQISVETGLHRDRIYSRISKGKKKIRKFFKDKDYGGEGNETRI